LAALAGLPATLTRLLPRLRLGGRRLPGRRLSGLLLAGLLLALLIPRELLHFALQFLGFAAKHLLLPALLRYLLIATLLFGQLLLPAR
jgi:hypothetical protein